MNAEFQETFEVLKDILAPYAEKLLLMSDKASDFQIYTEQIFNKKNVYFAGTTIKKNYVSFYFMPIYTCPRLLDSISPGLKKRKQGKACFNFKSVDQIPVSELKKLVKAGAGEFKKMDFSKLQY